MKNERLPVVVLLGTLYSDEAAELLRHHATTIDTASLENLPTATLRTAQAIIVRYPNLVPEERLREMGDLKVIVASGSGSDNIDVEAARGRGVKVATCRGVNAISVAEHTLAFILGLTRRIDQQHRSGRTEFWSSVDVGDRIELAGTHLGVLGVGAVGAHVARLGNALGCHVLAYDPVVASINSEYVQQCESMDELFSRSRIISVHVPLSESTRSLVSETEIRAMPPSSYLVCTSRGGIVDELALAAALSDGHLAGAALDVFTDEPLGANSVLWSAPNLLMTPHVADATEECRRRMSFAAVYRCLEALEALPGTGNACVERSRDRVT